LDSTEPAVLEEGLNHLGAKAILNSVNYEDGDLPDSRFRRTMALAVEHGAAVIGLTIDEEGQARTRENKIKIARRLISQLHDEYGLAFSDILIDTLTFPIATGQEETRRDGLETLAAIEAIKMEFPEVLTVLGLSNVSFGLNPLARQVLNSVFLHMATEVGLDAAIVHPARILPLARVPAEQLAAARDLILDNREYDDEGNLTKDPLANFMALFADSTQANVDDSDEIAWQALPVSQKLNRRILEAKRKGLEEDLNSALETLQPLEIVNDVLLPAMREVGDLFGAGQMQLPFVLASAEVMKSAVAHLEPHMEKSDESGKGTMVLATVKGDVHDIGKNLVDIILTNNGYRVVNLGIKQPINNIIEAAETHGADAIGMSGLLVKSTVIMKENLQEIEQRGLAGKYPVVLGGAALTRAYVEDDLASTFSGEVRYAKDAFEGLALMDSIMSVKRGDEGASLPSLRLRKFKKVAPERPPTEDTRRSDIKLLDAVPTPPFLGSRVVKGLSLAEYSTWLDERATFLGQWGLKSTRGEGPTYEELVETEGRPRLRWWLDRVATESLLDPGVVYGFFPANSVGNEIVIYHHEGPSAGQERMRLKFPRQTRDKRLCLADYLRPVGSGPDHVAFHVVTMGSRIDEAAAQIFERNEYREYLELHGLSVQLTEALAEYWHARIRSEWGIGEEDSTALSGILKQEYQGERFSFGYPACPDLSQQTLIMELLEPRRIGVDLSEEFQLHPEQSTSAIIFHHPEANYFNAG
jgi:5-methyltetrahydrofolate--homocysteine methyltransferase